MTQHGLTKEQFAGKGLVTAEDVLKLVNGHKASEPQRPAVHSDSRPRPDRRVASPQAHGSEIPDGWPKRG